MRIFFVGGAALLALALAGAVLQSMARLMGATDGSMLTSAYDIWYGLWPGNLVVTKIRVEQIFGAWAWDPVLRTVLVLPAWALAAIPGILLMWVGWLTKGPRTEEDIEAEDAVFLFDSLAAQAKAEEAEFAEFQRTVDAGDYDDVVGSTLRAGPADVEAVDEAELPAIEIVDDRPTGTAPVADERPEDEDPKV